MLAISATLEERVSAAADIFGRERLLSHTVKKKERWIHLSLLVEALVKESDTFVVLIFELALDALILHELQLFLLFGHSVLPHTLWHL